ncbi:hypothetical protein FB45DRAFT_738618 [Roridomyces roridus]|uniref:SMP-30/Gluconolactonase/LRE-like region domain-containing protein n=1 Tax=Roridomyces roridus TaxID=1738132 RepID=A0AAD7FXF8_9AGAR|nr:hypothetical protein FB45DRAFT_738618 [Roridomyces roridus]
MSFENLAVRASGELLITSVVSPTLNSLDPTATTPTLTPVFTFPDATGLSGIGEIRPGVFAIIAAVRNGTTDVPGTASIWTVDFTTGKTPTARLGATIPTAGLANGLGVIPGDPDLVLIADAVLGLAWGVNVRTGNVSVFMQTPEMAPIGASAPAPVLGINGLHVQRGMLHFTNSQQQTFFRVPLAGGTVGTVGTGMFDDFTLDGRGRAWLATNPGSLTLISPLADGTFSEATVVNTTLNGPSSAAFGRKLGRETTTLFMTSRGGQIVSVDTSSED